MKIQTGNAASRVTDNLRAAILSGRWVPSSRMQPAHLALEFGVSTTIIRESLTRLSGEGLINILPNRGFFIPELKLRELRDITELRIASESIAVRLSLTRGDLHWESELTATHHKLSRTQRRSDKDPGHFTPEWSRLHRAFHQELIGACGCEPMLMLSANLATKTELYRQWAAPTDGAVQRDVEREHLELLQAALARDIDLTTELLATHYQRTVDIVLHSGLTFGTSDV
jgi:DNA-binding GntR family transcriptional regulator